MTWPRTAPLAVLLAVAPLLLLPSLALGAGGRLRAVQLSPDYRQVEAALAAAPEGAVASAPWGQYRRYPWNADRVSLDVLPRVLDRRVVVDDSLPLRSERVPGEDPVAGSITRALDDGTELSEVLRTAGIRFVVVDVHTGSEDLAAIERDDGTLLFSGRDLALVDLGPDERTGAAEPLTRVPSTVALLGAAISVLGAGAVLGALGLRWVRHRTRPDRTAPTRQ